VNERVDRTLFGGTWASVAGEADSSTKWHSIPPEAALDHLDASTTGLDEAEAARRRAEVGPNELPSPPRPSALRQLLGQFADPLVGALMVAAGVSLTVALSAGSEEGWGRFGDTFAIILIVTVNALLGFFQERRAEAALDALAELAAPTARVLRRGALKIVPARELVPGDVVDLEGGDAVPADLRLFLAHELTVEEASLTGESVPSSKARREVEIDTGLGDRSSMAYLGTTVARGHGRGVVVATGSGTELGRIGALLDATERAPTPLEVRLGRLGRWILLICLALSVVLFFLGLFMGTGTVPVLLLTAVSLAVAAIPEGLPAITTITLALGMQRMAAHGAIVRKLPAVETLGSATIVCSDKTGTLTQNEMSVRVLELADGTVHEVGDEAVEGPLGETARLAVAVGALCNAATIDADTGRVVGDPTEGALLTLARKAETPLHALSANLEEVRDLPFDSDRRRMTRIYLRRDGRQDAYVKGSADVILERCTFRQTDDGVEPLDEASRRALLARSEDHAREALRVLALAVRRDVAGVEDPEQELTFVGLVGMIDPPRPEAAAAVAECRRAGIQVVMITGDHALTAVAIARELDIWREDAEALTGTDIVALDDEALSEHLARVVVFARVTAEQKLRLVRLYKRRGEVVAMTGDGVNDAPALREAQIGVAMGKGGTDVARQASEMVLADDRFATIVEAVREGRAIYRNIQKFIFFLNSSNAGLVFAVIVGSFFPWMPQLTPLQLLWVNLVTNGLPALALGVDPPDAGQMDEPPRDPEAGIIDREGVFRMGVAGVVMGLGALLLQLLPVLSPGLLAGADQAEELAHGRALAFTLLALSPLFHAFNCRSRYRTLLQGQVNPILWAAIAVSLSVHLVTLFVPALHGVFRTHAPTAVEWGLTVALAAAPIPVFEVLKAVQRGLRGRA
jgi:Ca2+-transporting ATPase